MFKALQVRDFRLLWAGGTVSALGSWLLVLAVPAHVYLATDSLSATGLTLAAEYLPLLLLGPVAGVLTDRWSRRRVLLATDVFSAMVVAAMLLGLGPSRYWVFYLALAAESSAGALAGPALSARIPAIVGTGAMLNSANSLNAFSNGIVRLIGGPLGGILFASLGIRVLIVADVFSYVVAAGAIMMTAREAGRGSPDGGSLRAVRRELREGVDILLGEPIARGLLPISVIFLTANAGLTAVVVAFGIRQLGGSGPTGFLFAALGTGFLLGAPTLRLTLDRFPVRYLLAVTLAATASSYWLLFHSSSLRTAVPSAVAVGMFGSMSLVIAQTTVQRVIPNVALGRVSSVFLTGEAAASLAGAVAGPILAQVIHLGGLAAIASLTTAAAAVLTLALIPPLAGGRVQRPG